MIQKGLLVVETQDALKAMVPSADLTVLILEKSQPYDGQAGFYRWNPDSTEAEDPLFMKSFPASGVTTGRWVRIFQRAQTMGAGVLVNNGGVKSFYASGTTAQGLVRGWH